AVLHDLETGKIAAIYNNLSKRKVGDRSAISKFVGDSIDEFPDVFEPYYKTNWDGKKFKCVSVTVRDDKGKPIGLTCFNFDTSVFDGINQSLSELLSIATKQALNPIEQYTEDWQARVNECIGNYLKENHTTLPALTKEQKREAVNRLYNHGLFNYRNAAVYVSEQMHVSRATVYNYLKEEKE
ncbi:MAG TPA: helix-turn-helix domain-containing protein, partial [Candidatus Saccharimonadales bacterium]|nr:helix-turn-helix domain-containing protein [Candidatus Saccharimonadales bacterium]